MLLRDAFINSPTSHDSLYPHSCPDDRRTILLLPMERATVYSIFLGNVSAGVKPMQLQAKRHPSAFTKLQRSHDTCVHIW